jgi:hypothetical protein
MGAYILGAQVSIRIHIFAIARRLLADYKRRSAALRRTWRWVFFSFHHSLSHAQRSCIAVSWDSASEDREHFIMIANRCHMDAEGKPSASSHASRRNNFLQNSYSPCPTRRMQHCITATVVKYRNTANWSHPLVFALISRPVIVGPGVRSKYELIIGFYVYITPGLY